MFPSPSKRLVKSKSGLKIVCQQERGVPPWSLEEPHWIDDKDAEQCSECKAKFTFVRRKHHCRRCGRIFCGSCCGQRVQFHRMGFVDPVRQCAQCAGITRAEAEFFDADFKLLLQGAPFHVQRPEAGEPTKRPLYNCSLTSDERFVAFAPFDQDGDGENGQQQAAIEPVDLCRIVGIDTEGEGGEVSCLCIRARESASSEFELRLEPPAEPSRKPSVAWISAFKKGMRMVFESRAVCRGGEDAADNGDQNENGGGAEDA